MNCDTCKERQKQAESISAWTHEADMARMERTIEKNHKEKKWLIIALFLSWVIFWAGFLIRESQFETVSETTTTQEVWQEAKGDNSFVGGDYYGETTH